MGRSNACYLNSNNVRFSLVCMQINDSLASRLQYAREQRGLSQAQLADKIGTSQVTIAHIESARNQTSKKVVQLAMALGVPAEWLETGARHDEVMREVFAVESGETAPSANSLSGAAEKVLALLEKHGKTLTPQAQERLLGAVSESLDDDRAGKVVTGNFSRAPKLLDGDILIPQYDLRASMGHGQVPADYVEFMRNVVVSGVQLEKLGLDFTSPANLSIITGWGESMAPTIKSKDPVIVDRGITEFIGDGVYVISWDDMLYIKRLQNAGDGKLDLISDNPKHKARVVSADEVTIHAKVLLVWNASKL